MAECAYARCLQERRLIKRELMKWSKDMLHIVGLERVAEELMGRRKWKHYQDSLTRTHLSTDQLTATIDQLNIETQRTPSESDSKYNCSIKTEEGSEANKEQKQQTYEENHRQKEAKEEAEVNQDQKQENKVETTIKSLTIKGEDEKEGNKNSTTTTSHIYIYNNNNNNNTSVKLENNNSITNENLKASSTPVVSPVTKNCDKNITNLRLHRSSTTPDKEEDYTSVITPPPPEPIDWKPNEKCYFCVDGKLLTVNSKGDLVAESGPALSEADHGQRQLIDSDSDSNDSCIGANNSTSANSLSLQSVTGGTAGNQRVNVNKILASRLRDLPANMTSMNPMAAQFAAIQSISGQLYPNLHWLQQLQQQQQQNNSATPTTSDTSAAAVSPAPKDSPSPSDATGEQPLDLSSKPSPNSSISGDLKSLSVRSKTSRSTPVLPAVGRRTYTDDDLNSALQDIISGKLGTRKASVCYNIPRSTLRNKVYKLTTDAKRANATAPAELLQLQQALELEKDLSGDEGEGESNASTPQPAEAYDDLATATLRKLCENNTRSEDVGVGEHNATASPKIAASSLVSALSEQLKRKSSTPSSGGGAQPPQPTPSPQPQIPPILIDPNVFLQTLLLSTGALQNPAALQPKLDETVTLRDLFGAILLNSGINLKDILASANAANSASNAGDTLNNGSGKSNSLSDQRLLLQQLHHQQQQQQHPISGQHQQSPPSTSAHYSRRLPKSDTPETTSSLDLNEISDDPSVILKIPSYKPVAGSSTSAAAAHLGHGTTSTAGAISPSMHCSNNSNSNRNGDSPHSQHSAQSPRIATSMLAAAVAAASGNKNSTALHHQNNSISVISPPLGMGTDSQSPPSLSLREVFANSIQRTMNEQANKDAHASMLGLGVDSERNSSDYKKPSISVVKNIGGTDTSRFGEAPNLLTGVGGVHNSHHLHHHPHLQHPGHHHHHSSHHLSRQEAAALAAGKGTRPKRGKYRNYDRDSLVEAVKAVQRGEMSVHRAGSYYGVPHSTLEYKVKERHLMRPRKREPKPQPPDGSGTSTSASKTNSNIPGLDRTAANNLDKLSKANPSAGASKISGALKNNANPAAFPSNSPNGMKLSMFDQSVTAAQLQYAPHLFWQHSAFGPLQMDFNRAAVAQQSSAGGVNASANVASASAASSALPYVSAEILKSHMQRYQEKSMRSTPGASGSSIKPGRPSPIASPMSGQNHHALSYKSPHDLAAENGGGFLEGIIRQRLDRKSNDAAPPPVSDALLGQLLTKKTPLPFTNNRGSTDYITTPGNSAATSSGVSQLKRTGSPLPAYGSVDIKRERGSPMHSDMDGDGDASVSETDEHSEHNNNNNKTLMNSDKLERRGGGERHALERSRMTSRDSDTDGGGSSNGGSLKSGGISLTNEQLSSQYYNNNSNDINGGGGGSGGPLTLKAELSGATTSILQEKLGQIKSEQESEENL